MALNLPKKPKQSLWDKVRDVADANSQMDQYKRAKAGQPLDYATQQKALGNQRPNQNIGQALLGNTARAINTVGQFTYDTLPRVGAALAVKGANRAGLLNDQQYSNAANFLAGPNAYKGYKSTGGLFNAGTVIDSPEQAQDLTGKDVARKSLGYGAGVYGELGPVGAKGGFLKRTGIGATEAALGDVGSQYVNTGKINLKQTAQSAAFGGALPNIGPIFKGGKKAAQAAPDVVRKFDPTNELRDQVKVMQRAFDVETNPTRRAQINQGIAQLNGEIRAISQGGYVGKKQPTQKPVVSPKAPKTNQVSSIAQGRAVEAPKAPQANIKKTRLGSRVDEQGLTPELTQAIKDETPTYKTAKLKEVTAVSRQTIGERLKTDPDGAFEEAISKARGEMNIQDGADIVEAIRHFDNTGDTVRSQTLYDLAAEKFSKKGQELNAAKLFYAMTPQGISNKFVRDIEAKTGQPIDPIVKSRLDDLVDRMKTTDPDSYDAGLLRKEIETLKGKTIGSPWYKKLTSLWKTGLLTSPSTLSGNFIGNSAETIYKLGYVDPLASLMDGVASLFTGKRSKGYTTKGVAGGIGEGIQEGFKYFKTGFDPRRTNTDYSEAIYFSDSPVGKAAEAYTGTVMKLMGAGDQPFYYAHFRNSLQDQALAEGMNRGLKGKELKKFANDLASNPEDKMLQTATNEALYYTFNNPTKLSNIARKIQEQFPVAGEVLIPFSTVPSSIATRLIQRNPVGLAFRIAKEIKNVARDGKPFGQREFVQDVAESTAALPLFVGGAVLANSGAITLGFPKDQTEAKQWELENKQPYSVKVGDRWYSLNYVQPFAAMLAIGGGYQNAINEGVSQKEAMGIALAEGGKAFTEQSFLRGINQANAAITSPVESAGALVESYASSVVPNIIRRIASATDTVQGREVEGPVDAIKSAIPGQRQTLEARTNQYGEVIPNSMGPNKGVGSVIEGLASPFKARDINQDPVVGELTRLSEAGFGATPSVVQSNFMGKDVKLTPEERRQIENTSGPLIKKAHTAIMSSDAYQSIDDESRMELLREATNSIRRALVNGEEPPTAETILNKKVKSEAKKKKPKASSKKSTSRSGARVVRGGKSSGIDANRFLFSAPAAKASARPSVSPRRTAKYAVANRSSGKPKVTVRKSKV